MINRKKIRRLHRAEALAGKPLQHGTAQSVHERMRQKLLNEAVSLGHSHSRFGLAARGMGPSRAILHPTPGQAGTVWSLSPISGGVLGHAVQPL